MCRNSFEKAHVHVKNQVSKTLNKEKSDFKMHDFTFTMTRDANQCLESRIFCDIVRNLRRWKLGVGGGVIFLLSDSQKFWVALCMQISCCLLLICRKNKCRSL